MPGPRRGTSLAWANLRPHDRDHYLPLAGVVELDHEHALVAAQLELPVDDRDGLAGLEHEVGAVGVTVWAFVLGHVHGPNVEVVVGVVLVDGGNRLQEGLRLSAIPAAAATRARHRLGAEVRRRLGDPTE